MCLLLQYGNLDPVCYKTIKSQIQKKVFESKHDLLYDGERRNMAVSSHRSRLPPDRDEKLLTCWGEM